MGTEPTRTVIAPGKMVDHFRIMRLLGRGGMGEVYLARDCRLGRKVALKVVHPELLGQHRSVDRFLSEARTTARFNHPHIVTVFAVGEVDDCPYLALEYLEGQTLRHRVAEGPFSLREALRVGLAIAKALQEAHGHQILHRDLKPENVLLPPDGRPRVVDFGLAKAMSAPKEADLTTPPEVVGPEHLAGSHTKLVETVDAPSRDRSPATGLHDTVLASAADTLVERSEYTNELLEPTLRHHLTAHTEGLCGTPAYMAPEQWMQRPGSPATDVWALGVILFELLAGRRPYPERSPLALALVVTDETPVPDIETVTPVPQELAELIGRCLDKDAARRPAAAEAAQILTSLLAGSPAGDAEAVSPFRGLLPFSERHAAFFYGRDAESAALTERLREQPVLPLAGPSGSGKSSLVRAGIIPRLREQGRWTVLILRPGRTPFETLAARLHAGTHHQPDAPIPSPRWSQSRLKAIRAQDLQDGPEAVDADEDALGAEDSPTAQLAGRLRDHPQRLALELQKLAADTGTRVLLVVDQLEEIFTLQDDVKERRRFMTAICRAADDPQDPVRVIVTLRDDFLGKLAEGPIVRQVLGQLAVVRNPELEALREILTRPLESVGYRYEDPSVVEEMLAEVGGEPASLPLLQFTCHALWQRRETSRRIIPRSVFDDLGGVSGALARHADGVLDGLSTEQLGLARQVLTRLVTADSTRRTVPLKRLLEDLPVDAGNVLDRMVRLRLLSVQRGEGVEESTDIELELAHESLIHRWHRLSRWLDESREDRGFLEEVEQAADLWVQRGELREEVWRGAALAEAQQALDRCTEPVALRIRQFLAAGEQQRLRHRRRRRWLLVVGGVVLTLVAAVSLVITVVVSKQSQEVAKQRDQARRAQRLAEQLRAIAETKRAASDREGARAALLRGDVLEARAKVRSSLERHDTPMVRALWWKLRRNPLIWKREQGSAVYDLTISRNGRRFAVALQSGSIAVFEARTFGVRVLRGHTAQATAVALGPMGNVVASGTRAGTLWIRDATTGELRQRLVGHKGAIWGVAISPDGRTLVSSSSDRTARLWDLRSGRQQKVLLGHKATLSRARFSPDGKLVATGSFDRTVRIWRVATGAVEKELRHDTPVSDVSFDPRGRWLASAAKDGSVYVWSVPTGKLLHRLRGHSQRVNSIRFSADGALLASASTDRTIRLWEASSGRLLHLFRGHTGGIWSIAFMPRSRELLTGGSDRTIRLWRTQSLAPTQPPSGHDAPVMAIDFSPSGQQLASAGNDRTIRLWNRATGEVTRVITGHEAPVSTLAYRPRGKSFASGSRDRTVRLWDASTGRALGVLRGHEDHVTAVAYSPDGQRLASGSTDRTVRLWDPDRRSAIRVLRGHSTSVWSIKYSPDGRRLASASWDGLILLWDPANGRIVHRLTGHRGNVWSLHFSRDGKTLLSTGFDQTVRRWNLVTGKGQVIHRAPGRINVADLSPDGRQLALPLKDGTIRLLDLQARTHRSLVGHHREVNQVRFGSRGKTLASVSDDGTVRLWNTVTTRPRWYTTAVLMAPVRLHTHQGWQALERPARSGAAPSPFAAVLATRAVSAAVSSSGGFACLITRDGWLERWQRQPPQRRFRRRVGAVSRLVATSTSCLVHSAKGLLELDYPGRSRELARQSSAFSLTPKGLLVASDAAVVLLDGARRPVYSQAAPHGITALQLDGEQLVVGFADGSIELRQWRNKKVTAHARFEHVPASPVRRLIIGPRRTLIAGYANGFVGIWSMASGRQLSRTQLHGPITHLVRHTERLHAVSALGSHRTLKLDVFLKPYCELMRDVWRRVHVAWEGGLPVMKSPLRSHRCR